MDAPGPRANPLEGRWAAQRRSEGRNKEARGPSAPRAFLLRSGPRLNRTALVWNCCVLARLRRPHCRLGHRQRLEGRHDGYWGRHRLRRGDRHVRCRLLGCRWRFLALPQILLKSVALQIRRKAAFRGRRGRRGQKQRSGDKRQQLLHRTRHRHNEISVRAGAAPQVLTASTPPRAVHSGRQTALQLGEGNRGARDADRGVR
jgi:hypothetical protein